LGQVKRKKQLIIPATVLFADLREYTSLSQGTAPEEVAGMLHDFYDASAAAVWERDGIVNKFIGDAVLAIFNFPIMREDHVRRAVLAGIELQKRCSEKTRLMVINADGKRCPVGVGIGIHTGDASIGEVGNGLQRFYNYRSYSQFGLSHPRNCETRGNPGHGRGIHAGGGSLPKVRKPHLPVERNRNLCKGIYVAAMTITSNEAVAFLRGFF
jgi:hypothetical protein